MPVYQCRKCGNKAPLEKWTISLQESEDAQDRFVAMCPKCGETNVFKPPQKDKKDDRKR